MLFRTWPLWHGRREGPMEGQLPACVRLIVGRLSGCRLAAIGNVSNSARPVPVSLVLDKQNIEHVRGAPFHPQTQGKIERWHQTLKNRILLEHYHLPGDLEHQVAAFVAHYNHARYHESLDNLTPADIYFGRAEAILLERERIKRQTIAKPSLAASTACRIISITDIQSLPSASRQYVSNHLTTDILPSADAPMSYVTVRQVQDLRVVLAGALRRDRVRRTVARQDAALAHSASRS